MPNLPVVNFETIQKRLGQEGTGNGFILHQLNISNAPKWEVCRMEVYFIGFLQTGELLIESDLVSQKIKAPAIFAMAPSVIRKFVHGSRNFKSEVIFFEKSFFLRHLSDVTYLDRYDFFYNRSSQLLRLNTEQKETFLTYFKLIKNQIKQDGDYRNDIVRNILQILLLEIAASGHRIKSNGEYSYNEVIFSRFKSNLEEHYRTARKVSFYASLQSLSPKYFSGIIQQQTGKTAGEMIDERVVLEAQALLQNKALTINQVALLLNFDDASNFGKYFKNLTGSSPLGYRKSIFQ